MYIVGTMTMTVSELTVDLAPHTLSYNNDNNKTTSIRAADNINACKPFTFTYATYKRVHIFVSLIISFMVHSLTVMGMTQIATFYLNNFFEVRPRLYKRLKR